MTHVRVTVPCSTSNLGAGFDCVGLALNRHLVATFQSAAQPSLERHGTFADIEGDDIVTKILGDHGIRGHVTLESNIPIGKGLGSSAAATVAALAIASAVANQEFDRERALQEATALEGHPDNSAPALLGGLVGIVNAGNRKRAVQLHLSEEIAFVFAAPRTTISTKAARRVLPEQVAHAVAARTAARSIALIEGLAEGDPELLRIGFEDELHVPFRLGMIAGGESAVRAAQDAGAWAATISGSGSGIIAACDHAQTEAVLAAMKAAFEQATADEAVAFIVEPDHAGLQIERLDG